MSIFSKLLLCSLAVPALLVSASGHAEADSYVTYRSYITMPPPAAPWAARVYGPIYPVSAPPSCRFAGDFAGPAHAPQQGFVFQCWEPVEVERRHRTVVRVKG